MSRRRLRLAAVLVSVGAMGYWLRFDAPVSDSLRDSLGGVAYVVFWILAAAVIWTNASALRLAAIVLGVTCGLEFLQLWHPQWLEQIRRTFTGRVLLGTTFDWSDFPPYVIGAVVGRLLVRGLALKRSR